MNNNNNENRRPAQGQSMGFIDDYANDNIRNTSTLRKRDGKTVYANPLENDKKPKRRITKNNRKRYRGKNRAFVLIGIFLAAVVALSVYFIVKKPDTVPSEGKLPFDTSTPSQEQNMTETEETTEKKDDFVVLSSDEIHKGNLILVNYKHEYIFPENDILVSMYDKESIYSVNATETLLQQEAIDAFSLLCSDFLENSGCDDVLVVSAFRSIEKQQEIYKDRLDRYGSEYAAKYVADPGYSEHHTGLALDLQIYVDGAAYDIETYEKSAWFNENYDEYGYILRYPEDKASITSINYESWHYRYVGLPHSLIMGSKNLCLEEYIEYLKDFTFETPLIYNKHTGEITKGEKMTESAGKYIIYYVPAQNDETKIPIIPDSSYTVSGNNADGFIVTVSPSHT